MKLGRGVAHLIQRAGGTLSKLCVVLNRGGECLVAVS